MDEIVRASGSGNSVSLRRGVIGDLYERHIEQAIRLGFVLTGTREGGEDLAHEAFVRVASRITILRDETRFAPYLKRTVVNLAHSAQRKHERERRFIRRQASLALRVEQPHDPGNRDVWTALLNLPPRQRAALFFRYHEDFSFPQIAEMLDCSTGAAKALSARALRSLRSELGGHNE
jgi:RNA polymerase sigma factor (sigma-70 family)